MCCIRCIVIKFWKLIGQMQRSWHKDRIRSYPCVMLRLTTLKELYHVCNTMHWCSTKKNMRLVSLCEPALRVANFHYKGHSSSPWPLKNIHNFSLECPTKLHHFHIIVLPVLFCVCKISIHCFIIELIYTHVLTLGH